MSVLSQLLLFLLITPIDTLESHNDSQISFLNQMKSFENPDHYSEIRRLTLIGGVLDLFLGFVKVLVGYIGNSQALIADGIHSLSDLITDVLVLAATKHSAQAVSYTHLTLPTNREV